LISQTHLFEDLGIVRPGTLVAGYPDRGPLVRVIIPRYSSRRPKHRSVPSAMAR
jgi:hypothetical protein